MKYLLDIIGVTGVLLMGLGVYLEYGFSWSLIAVGGLSLAVVIYSSERINKQ